MRSPYCTTRTVQIDEWMSGFASMGYYQATSMVVGCKNLYRIAEEEEQVHITGKYNLVCDSNLEYFAWGARREWSKRASDDGETVMASRQLTCMFILIT